MLPLRDNNLPFPLMRNSLRNLWFARVTVPVLIDAYTAVYTVYIHTIFYMFLDYKFVFRFHSLLRSQNIRHERPHARWASHKPRERKPYTQHTGSHTSRMTSHAAHAYVCGGLATSHSTPSAAPAAASYAPTYAPASSCLPSAMAASRRRSL